MSGHTKGIQAANALSSIAALVNILGKRQYGPEKMSPTALALTVLSDSDQFLLSAQKYPEMSLFDHNSTRH